MKFRNNQSKKSQSSEINNGISETVPGQALSLQTLIERHTRGQFVPQTTQKFEGDLEFVMPDMTKMTVLEKLDYLNEFNDSVVEYKKQMKSNYDERVQKLKDLEKAANTKQLIKEAKELQKLQDDQNVKFDTNHPN